MAAGVQFAGSWNDPLHQIWNSVALLVTLAFVVMVIRVPTDRYGQGWKDKRWWLWWAIFPVGFGFGLYLPIGVLIAGPLFLRSLQRGSGPFGGPNSDRAHREKQPAD